jgi:hypothetical protein
MCGCIFALISLASPRLAFIFLWIFTSYVERALPNPLHALAGLIFLPFTSVVYVLVYSPTLGVSGWGWLLVGIAFLIDLGSYGGSAYGNRDYVPRKH